MLNQHLSDQLREVVKENKTLKSKLSIFEKYDK